MAKNNFKKWLNCPSSNIPQAHQMLRRLLSAFFSSGERKLNIDRK